MNPKKHLLALAVVGALAAPLAVAGDMRFSGFLSLGGGLVDDAKSQSYGGYSEEDITFDHNIFGLQVSGDVSDKLTATVQLTARGSEDYQVNTEWAYVSWQATDNSKVRMGRLRTPFYMYSDFLDVGYAYPWISPPREVYYLPFNNVDGVDFYTSTTWLNLDATVQAYFGGFDDQLDLDGDGVEESAKTRNQMGLAGTLGRDWWTLRAAYHQADLTIDVMGVPLGGGQTLGDLASLLSLSGFSANADKLLVDEDKASFAELGLNIDTGTFVAAAEHVEFEAKNSLLSKNIREYVMGGVRFGSWLVHVTASKTKDEVSHPEAGIPLAQQTALLIGTLQAVAQSQVIERDVITLGTRWDLTAGTALKLQYDDVSDDVRGDQKVYSFAVQTVF